MSSAPVKARLVVTPRNEDQIRLLVNHTKTQTPILYDAKSGVNLRRILPSAPPSPPVNEFIEVPIGADCMNLVKLHSLGCFELVSGAIFDETIFVRVQILPYGEIRMVFNQDVYTNALRSDEISVGINEVPLLPENYQLVQVPQETPQQYISILTTQDLGLDQEIFVRLREEGAVHVLGVDDVAVEGREFIYVSPYDFSDAKELTEFKVGYIDGGSETRYPGTIDEELYLITMQAQRGTHRESFFQEFVLSDNARLVWNNDLLLSGGGGPDYRQEVQFLAQAEDGTAQMWTVRCGIEACFMTFKFTAEKNQGVILEDKYPIIDHAAKTIEFLLPAGTNVTALVPTFTVEGGTMATIGAVLQESGTTAADFTNPVVYTVTDDDTNTNDYTVTVTVLP